MPHVRVEPLGALLMFSVVIRVYNHAKFVKQAIWSALRCPLATEILVVDDGSKDGSRNILASLAAARPGRVRDLTLPSSGGNHGAHQRLKDQAGGEWRKTSGLPCSTPTTRLWMAGFESIVQDPGFAGCEFAFGNLLFMDAHGALTGAKARAPGYLEAVPAVHRVAENDRGSPLRGTDGGAELHRYN